MDWSAVVLRFDGSRWWDDPMDGLVFRWTFRASIVIRAFDFHAELEIKNGNKCCIS